MFKIIQIYQIAAACRDSVIGIQSDQLDITKKVSAAEKRVEYFNDELLDHSENWTKVIGRMRKVWKLMKSDFEKTRNTVTSMHKRLSFIENQQGFTNNGSDMEEYFDDFDNLLLRIKNIEEVMHKQSAIVQSQDNHLNGLVDIVHSMSKRNKEEPSQGRVNLSRYEELFRSLEARLNNQTTRLSALERESKESGHKIHYAEKWGQ